MRLKQVLPIVVSVNGVSGVIAWAIGLVAQGSLWPESPYPNPWVYASAAAIALVVTGTSLRTHIHVDPTAGQATVVNPFRPVRRKTYSLVGATASAGIAWNYAWMGSDADVIRLHGSGWSVKVIAALNYKRDPGGLELLLDLLADGGVAVDANLREATATA